MLALEHAPDVCVGNVDTAAFFRSHMLNFYRASKRPPAQFHLAELERISGRTSQRLARRRRHTRRHLLLATPGDDVGGATCA